MILRINEIKTMRITENSLLFNFDYSTLIVYLLGDDDLPPRGILIFYSLVIYISDKTVFEY